MGIKLVVFAVAAMTTSLAQAGSQSSNTSSNSSSNNGIVRQRFVDTYCQDDYCDRFVQRRYFAMSGAVTNANNAAIETATSMTMADISGMLGAPRERRRR